MNTHGHIGSIKSTILIIVILVFSKAWSETDYLDTSFTLLSKGYVNNNGNSIFEMLGGTEGDKEYSYSLNWGLSSVLPVSMVIHDSMLIPEYSGVYQSLAVTGEGLQFYASKDGQWMDSLLPASLDSISITSRIHTFALLYSHNPSWDIEWDKATGLDDIMYIKSNSSKNWFKLQIDTIYTSSVDETWRVVESIDSLKIKIASDSIGNGKFMQGNTSVLQYEGPQNRSRFYITGSRLVLPENITSGRCVLFSINGQKISDQGFSSNSLSLEGISPGVYSVSIYSGVNLFTKKLLIK